MKINIREALPDSRINESIFVFERPYFLAFLPWFAIGIGLIVMGAVISVSIALTIPATLADPFGYDVFVIIVGSYFLTIIPFITAGFINYYLDIYVVTDQRLIDISQNQLFSRQVNELSLEDVEDVSAVTKGYLSSIFDFGDVMIETAGAEEKFSMKQILHPREIAGIILDLAEQAKERLENHDDPEATLVPRGGTKGVIQGQILTTTAPLSEIGAMANSAPKINDFVPPAESTATSASKQAESNGNLDIVIDDPNQQPPKAS